MIPDRERQQLEQMFATTRDTYPRLWWALYSGSIAAGFNPNQALSLVQTFIMADKVTSVRPNDIGDQKRQEDE